MAHVRGWSCPRSWMIPWDSPPSEGHWLCAGGNSVADHSKVEASLEKYTLCRWASLVAQVVKNPPAVWKTQFHPWIENIPWRREWLLTPVFLPREFHGQLLQSVGSQRVRHDWATNTSTFTHCGQCGSRVESSSPRARGRGLGKYEALGENTPQCVWSGKARVALRCGGGYFY